MLALTGAKADGWLPSMGYIELDELPARNAAIDSAAVEAGRRPDEIRRLLNVNGPFGGARDWAEQLAELTLSTGMSTYILSVSSDDEVRRFAEEIAPAVRELVATGRGAEEAEGPVVVSEAPALSVFGSPTAPLAAAPTPDDGRRLNAEQLWDESTRPTAAPLDADREYTRQEQAAGQHLIDVHDHLRSELTQLRQLVEQVAAGNSSPNTVRSYINRMTIRQNNWTLGTFCETYCRTVTNHHMLEDRSVFHTCAAGGRPRTGHRPPRARARADPRPTGTRRPGPRRPRGGRGQRHRRRQPRHGPPHRHFAVALLLRRARTHRSAGAARLLLAALEVKESTTQRAFSNLPSRRWGVTFTPSL